MWPWKHLHFRQPGLGAVQGRCGKLWPLAVGSRAADHHYLHGAVRGPRRAGDRQGGGPSASGVPEPLLTEFRMSEIRGTGAEQTEVNKRQMDRQTGGGARLPPRAGAAAWSQPGLPTGTAGSLSTEATVVAGLGAGQSWSPSYTWLLTEGSLAPTAAGLGLLAPPQGAQDTRDLEQNLRGRWHRSRQGNDA